MTRLPLAVVIVALLIGPAGKQQATFKVRVELVSVDVLATDHGKPIAGLTSSDFEVRDNGVLQQVDSISGEGATGNISAQPVLLDVVLVFDTIESMAGSRLQQLVDAGKAVLAKLRPGDRAALVTFSERAVVRQSLSSDVASVSRSLGQLEGTGRTSIFDALYVGLSQRRSYDTRSMLLLFTDGQDNASWLNAKQISQVARESDVVLYAVGLDASVSDELKALAQETGGDTVVAASAKDLKTLFVRIVREMQMRYVLNYSPKGVTRAGWHTIEVRAPRKGAQIMARRGYYVPDR